MLSVIGCPQCSMAAAHDNALHVCLQLMDVAVKLPPFKPPKVAAVEYEAPQLLPLPDLLDEEVHRNACDSSLMHAES